MAIHNLTTIQDSNLLYDAYINEALANLGQRQGAHGDSINLESFMIGDIIDVTGVQDYINVGVSNPEENITLEFTSSTGESLEYIKNNSQEAQTEITPIEYIGEASKSETPVKFGDVKVDKYTKDNEYEYFLFKGVLNIDDIETYIVVLQIPINDYNSNINNNCNGILITDKWILKYSSSDVYLHTATLDEIKERIYNEFNNIDSVDALYNELKKVLTKPSYTINVEYFQNKFIYYFAVLPSYVNRFYNNNNILLNGETTLRQSIFNELIKIITTFAFSNSIEDDITENKLDDNYVVKISKDFKFNYFVNSNTKEYLYSLDIPVLYTETPDKININSNYIVAYSVYNKVSNFKFTVNYTGSANNETTEDIENKNITISVSKEYTLPYIATVVETDENDNIIYDTNHIAETKEVWFVNDVPTNVSPIGKDAGNPNIMLMVYDYDTTVTDGSVNPSIKVKHTFSDKQVRNIADLFTNIDYNNKITLAYKFDSNKANLTDQQTEVLGNSEYTLFTYDLPIVSIDVLKQYKYIWEVIAKNTLVMLSIDSRFLTIPNTNNTFTSLHDVINAGTDTTSYVTVFLHIVKREEETNTSVETYEWEIINNETLTDSDGEYSVALDLGSMLGIQNLVNYYTNTKYEPDTYFFDHLVFEKINSEIKQEQVDETKFIFPVLKVDNGTYYNQTNTNGSNDANFVPKFLLDTFVEYDNSFSGNRIKTIYDAPINNPRLQELFAIGTDSTISDVLKSPASNDYIPANGKLNSNTRDYFKDVYPIFDFREVITNNQTGLNRISLMGVDMNKTVYHGYFGHDATNTNNFDILTIGSSTTNWTLSNNLTVTADYDNFAKYAKLRLDMPTEETKLLFNKYNDGKYFSIVTLEDLNTINADVIETDNIKTVTSPYLSSPITVTSAVFNATAYINKYHNEYVNGGNDIKVRLQGNTEDADGYSGLNNNLVNIILYFVDNTATGASYLQKYELVGAEEIIKNTNYKLNFNTSANTIDTDEPITE